MLKGRCRILVVGYRFLRPIILFSFELQTNNEPGRDHWGFETLRKARDQWTYNI